jgi:methyl-accepting chemotaxis protein
MWIFLGVILVAVGGAVINGYFTRQLKEGRLGVVMREDTAEAARQADTDAIQGREIVDTAAGSIAALAGEVEQGVQHVRELEKDADSIGSVLDVIGGIAEQTNLLALNAAIEAARAGEQGRGFAVVADEVRSLAGRTQEATKEIQRMIETLQGRVSCVVAAMEGGRETAQTGVTHAKESGQSLARIGDTLIALTDQGGVVFLSTGATACTTLTGAQTRAAGSLPAHQRPKTKAATPDGRR